MDLLLIILPITFLLTGLVTGLIAGLLGVGGGIIIVPTTYFILQYLGYPISVIMHIAVASSLGIIFFTSISSVRSHIKLKNVDFSIIKKWYLGIITGSILGSFLASLVKGETLVLIFITLLLVISLNMFFQKKFIILAKDLPKNIYINFLISNLIGFFSVMMGIGGGSFTVPTLSSFSKPIHKAVGSSALIGFFIAVPGVIIFTISGSQSEGLPPYSLGYVNLMIVFLVSSTSIFTANIGAKLSSKIKTDTLKKIFAVFLFFTCISLIIEHFII